MKVTSGIIALGLTFTASAALAQSRCTERDDALEHLSRKYTEAPIAAGVTSAGGLVEVLANPTRTTWTIIVTTPQGVSCLVSAGEGWRDIQQVVSDPET